MPDNIASTETLELAPRLSFRWRVIPATIQLGMGLPTAVVAVIIVCTAVYMNVKHGWIIADIRTPKLNRYTLTPRLLLECVLTFWIGASHATAGWGDGCSVASRLRSPLVRWCCLGNSGSSSFLRSLCSRQVTEEAVTCVPA